MGSLPPLASGTWSRLCCSHSPSAHLSDPKCTEEIQVCILSPEIQSWCLSADAWPPHSSATVLRGALGGLRLSFSLPCLLWLRGAHGPVGPRVGASQQQRRLRSGIGREHIPQGNKSESGRGGVFFLQTPFKAVVERACF